VIQWQTGNMQTYNFENLRFMLTDKKIVTGDEVPLGHVKN